eukprot:350940-Chlamydomonas_euryale.AAC.4
MPDGWGFTWRKHYFAVSGGADPVIAYYQDSKGEGLPIRRPEHAKFLAGCTILDILDEDGKFKFTIHFASGWGIMATRWVLALADRDERTAWLETIVQLIYIEKELRTGGTQFENVSSGSSQPGGSDNCDSNSDSNSKTSNQDAHASEGGYDTSAANSPQQQSLRHFPELPYGSDVTAMERPTEHVAAENAGGKEAPTSVTSSLHHVSSDYVHKHIANFEVSNVLETTSQTPSTPGMSATKFPGLPGKTPSREADRSATYTREPIGGGQPIPMEQPSGQFGVLAKSKPSLLHFLFGDAAAKFSGTVADAGPASSCDTPG